MADQPARHSDCTVESIGVGEPCHHCGMSFGGCWDLDSRWCCGNCYWDGWSRVHKVEHQMFDEAAS